MGVAIAEAALARGARVTLICGHDERGAARRRAAGRGADRGRRCGTPSSTRCPTPTRSSWPPPWPTSGPASPRPRSSARGDGLILELEPTEDILAEASARLMHAARRRGRRPLTRRVRRRDRIARARPREGRSQAGRPAGRERCRRSRAPASAPTRTGSRSSRPGHPPEPWPLASKAQVAHDLLDRLVAIAADSAAERGASLSA